MEENLTERIRRLERELRDAQDTQRKCRHEFSEPVRATREVPEYIYDHLESHGSDPEPIYNVTMRTEYGWERSCARCGHTEYTNKSKPVVERHEPDFGGR